MSPRSVLYLPPRGIGFRRARRDGVSCQFGGMPDKGVEQIMARGVSEQQKNLREPRRAGTGRSPGFRSGRTRLNSR